MALIKDFRKNDIKFRVVAVISNLLDNFIFIRSKGLKRKRGSSSDCEDNVDSADQHDSDDNDM